MQLNETIVNIIDNKGIISILKEQGSLAFLTDSEVKSLEIDYYLNHSGQKIISPMFENLYLNYPADYLTKLSEILKLKFDKKWQRLNDVYFDTNYKAIENYSMIEEETPNLTHTTEKQTNTKLSTTNKNSNGVYGFNSDDSVPSDESAGESLIEGGKNDNTESFTESNTGVRTLKRSGNIGVTTSQQMLESELKLREYDLFDTIMRDIDSVCCLSVY